MMFRRQTAADGQRTGPGRLRSALRFIGACILAGSAASAVYLAVLATSPVGGIFNPFEVARICSFLETHGDVRQGIFGREGRPGTGAFEANIAAIACRRAEYSTRMFLLRRPLDEVLASWFDGHELRSLGERADLSVVFLQEASRVYRTAKEMSGVGHSLTRDELAFLIRPRLVPLGMNLLDVRMRLPAPPASPPLEIGLPA